MIGIFDSGLGGMTVTRAIEQLCPGFPLLYFGDLVRTPYGSKSKEVLLECACRNTDFLLEQGATIIVIACNSASSRATDILRERYQVPIIDVIAPAVTAAVSRSTGGRIGVIGTRATINSGIYPQRIKEQKPGFSVASQACPLLVPLVEEGWLDRRETKMIVRKYLHPLKNSQIDTLILGCTHYPLLKSVIRPRVGKRVAIIDSSVETALFLKQYLAAHPPLRQRLCQPGARSRFFVSDLPAQTANLANKIFDRPVTLEKVHV